MSEESAAESAVLPEAEAGKVSPLSIPMEEAGAGVVPEGGVAETSVGGDGGVSVLSVESETPSSSKKSFKPAQKPNNKKKKEKKKEKKKKGMFSRMFGGGENEDDEEEEVVDGESAQSAGGSTKSTKKEPKRKKGNKSLFSSLGLGSITSAMSDVIGTSMSAIGSVFKGKEDEEKRRKELAQEAAIAEELRDAAREEEKRLAEETRRKKEEEEAVRRDAVLDARALGDAEKWINRFRLGEEEEGRRKVVDPITFSWDGTVLLTDVAGTDTRHICIAAPSSKLRVFCSSTFTDTHKERNQLLGHVYKKIRGEAERRGIDFSFIDMRYGVRDENTLDHNTWEACRAELIRCREESAGLFFLSLQGQKYGYQCLPKYIPEVPFDTAREKRGTKETRGYADRWYLLDANQVPPHYTLKNLDRAQLKSTAWQDGLEYDDSYWGMFDKLRLMLDGISFDPDTSPLLTVGQSVTDWELISGTLEESDCLNGYWFHREFSDNAVWPKKGYKQGGDDKFAYWDYNDTHVEHCNEKARDAKNEDFINLHSPYNIEKAFLRRKEQRLRELKARMRDKFGKVNKVHDFRVLQFNSVMKQDNFFRSYINRFVEKSEELLLDNVRGASDVIKHWAFDGCGRGIDGKNLAEFKHHLDWARVKISTFAGREPLVARCVESVMAPNRVSTAEFRDRPASKEYRGSRPRGDITSKNAFMGVSTGIIGVSGSGKTALVARLAQEIKKRDLEEGKSRLFVLRFCGTSTASADPFELVQSIIKQILVSTQEPVEPLAQGSTVKYNIDGYGLWTPAVVAKAHEDGTFDVEYAAESSDDTSPDGLTLSKAPASPSAKYQRGTKDTRNMERATNQPRERIRLVKSSHDDFLYAHSKVMVRLSEEDIAVEISTMAWQKKERDEILRAKIDAGEAVAEKEEEKKEETKKKKKEGAKGEDRDWETGDMEKEEDEYLWRTGVVVRVNSDGTVDVNYTSKDGLCEIRKSGESRENIKVQKKGTYAEGKRWDFAHIPSTYERAVLMMHKLLARYPVVLIVDSLDQLSNNHRGRSEISFLRGVVPHPDTRIIVSTLPYNEEFPYLCENRLSMSDVPRVEVDKLVKDGSDVREVRDMANSMLLARKRALTEEQWRVFEKSVLAEPTALYMNLAVNSVMFKWKSYDETSRDCVLAPTVRGLIGQIFDDLEREFGRTLVDAIIMILTLSVGGVSDVEMQDLLSIDDRVLNFVFQYSRPDIERLPYHVWLRIRAALGPLLVEKEGGCLAWYHRQLREVALQRYHGDETNYYSDLMGRYYGNLLDPAIRDARLVKAQPLVLNDVPVFLEEAVVNNRRCIEASHHLVEAGLYDMAIDEMCSVEAVYANTRISQSHCYMYLQRVLQLHAVFGKMKSFTRSTSVNKSDMSNASRWLEGRVAVISGFIDAHIKSMVIEDPNMDSEHADLLRRMFENKFSDVRKVLDFHMLVDRNREGEYFDKYGEHAAEVRARLEAEYPLKMRSVVEHMTNLSRSVIQAFGVDADNESQVSSVAMQEQHNEELLAVLQSEQDEDRLDCNDFVSTRVAALQKDIDDLQHLRVARKQLVEENKSAAFDRLRAEVSLTDKAAVQRFYLAHFDDVRKLRPFIAKYKLTDRSDPDRDALRAALQEQFPTPVDMEVFPDRMVGLADNTVRGLGEHWAANEQVFRAIMESSGAPVFAEADKAAQKVLAAQVIVLQTENAGIPVEQLRKAEHFLYQTFKSASLTNNTKTLLRDKNVRTQINDEYPLADWLAVAREAEKRDRGPTMKREISKVGKGGKTLVEHMDELCMKFTKISQDMGADAEDDIDAVYKQRWHELHELSEVYKSYQGLCTELAAVDAWFSNRDTVLGKCLEEAVNTIHDENPDLKKGLLSLIATIFEDKFADLKTTRELHGVLTSDPVFAYAGDSARVRSALDQAFSEVHCADDLSGAERMLAMAVEVLAHFLPSDFAKEQRFNSRKELLQSEKEEVEALFAKYRTFLRKMEMVHLWTGRRRDVLAFSIREEVHRIEDQMPHVTVKQLRSISAYLTDRLGSLTKAHRMSDALQANSSSPMHVELLLELERHFPLKLSAEQLEQEEEMRIAFELRKMERAALRAQQEAEAATMAAALGNGDDSMDEAVAKDESSTAAFSGGLEEPSILTMDGVESAGGGPAEISPFAADAGVSPFGAGEEDFDGASWLEASEDGGDTHTDEATEEPDEWVSPYKNYTMPARLEGLLHRIFTRMDAVSDERPDSTDLLTAREHARALGAIEMENLEAAFRRYRNPRLEHLRKFEHYHRLLIREMSNMARDPLNGVYMACERQPYISEARKDFLALFSGYKRSKKMLNLAHVSNQDQVVPLYRSIGGLSHTFGPLVSMFNGHIGAVNSVAISSDESFVVSGGRDGTVKVWDSALGSVTFDLLGHEMEITSVCVSPDCSKVLSASLDGSVRLWDAAKGQVLCISSREAEDNFSHATDPTAHVGHVYALAISPDGRHFVSGGEDGMLSLRELDTLRFITSVPHDTPVRSLCYTPDGTKVVSGSGVSERTFGDGDTSSKGGKQKKDEGDTSRSKESKKKQGTPSPASEKGKGNNKGGGGGAAATAVASTTSSKKIRKADGIGYVRVFDVASHTLREDAARFEYFFGHVGSVAASDNTIVAAGSASKDTEFSLWNIKTREQQVFKGHNNKVTCVDISADGRRIVSGSWDDTARYWDASNASLIDTMEGHSGKVNQVCLAPSGSGLYTACQDEMVGVWDPTAVKVVKSSTSINEELHQVAVSHDGSTLVARTGTRSLILWSAISGKFLCEIKTSQPTTCVALSHDGMTVIAGQTDNCAHVWTRQASSKVATKAAFTLSGHTDEVLAVSCTDDLIFTGSADCTMRSYDAATGNFKCAFIGHEGPVVAVAASPVRVETTEDFAHQDTNSTFFGAFSPSSSSSSSSASASSSTGTSTGLNLSYPEEESKDAIQERPRSPSAYSIVGASGTPMSSKYRVRGGRAMPGEDSPHLPHKSPFKSDEPMEPIVVTASKDCTAIIWSLSGKKLQVLRGNTDPRKRLTQGHSRPVRSVAVDWSIPARPRIITGGDDDLIMVWAAGTGSLLGTMSGHSGEVRSVEVSADGRRIVSAADDKTIVVWDGHDFEELLTLRGHSAPVHKVHISHDGTSLVSAAEDQSVKVWKFVARNRLKTDWMGALHGAARGEKLIKSERLLFKERAVVLADGSY